MNLKIDGVIEIEVKRIAVVVTEMKSDVVIEKDVAAKEIDAVVVEEIEAAVDFLVVVAVIVGGFKEVDESRLTTFKFI